MPGLLLMAAAYPAQTRLLVAAAVFLVYLVLLPRPARRPLAVAGLCVLVVVWDFGATLIWGTGAASKVRFEFVLGAGGSLALLVCAVAGIIALAGALRLLAEGKTRAGAVLSAVFVSAFAGWSSAVRYSPIVAVVGLLAGGAALWWAATVPADDALSLPPQSPQESQARRDLLNAVSRVVLPCVSGLVFYAYLRWGPKSWVDRACGAELVLPAFILAVGASGLGVWVASRVAGKRAEAVAAAIVITALLAGVICVVAFLLWFGQNHCGE
jgi:hypothetical protein